MNRRFRGQDRTSVRKRFHAWQIEITSRCNLRCTMCARPQGVGSARKDMSAEEFGAIVPYLSEVENVVLEGWGESTLHPEIGRIAGMAREKGSRVGFVTNGTTLGDDSVREFIREGVDFMGVSVAGATPGTHAAIRRGSDLEDIFRGLSRLSGSIRGSGAPRLHVVFLLMKSNIHEAPLLVERVADAGVSDLVFLNLIHAGSGRQDAERIFAREGRKASPPEVTVDAGGGPYETILDEARRLAKKLKVSLTRPALAPGEVALCADDPLRNIYVAVDGGVSPCVFLSPPCPTPFRRFFEGEEHRVERTCFGNILGEPFEEIWERKPYVDFRLRFERRQARFDEIYEAFLARRLPSDGPLPPPPDPCATCYKLLGV